MAPAESVESLQQESGIRGKPMEPCLLFMVGEVHRERMPIMVASRGFAAWTGVALALSMLALAPSSAAPVKKAQKRGPVTISLSAPGSIGSFTPAANPKLAAAFARNGISIGSGGFRFTPAATPGSRRAVTVAVRARATTKAEAERNASVSTAMIAPTAYNLGVSVGWKRFALSGDIARVDGGLLPGREAVDLGVSYSGHKWTTQLHVGADRATGEQPRLIGDDEAYSADLSGSFALTRNLEVTGGVRYRLQRDRLEPIEDSRRDSQAVYIGTAFKF